MAKMCAIVFVERRCMADVIYAFLQVYCLSLWLNSLTCLTFLFLKDIRNHDATLEFVKPLYTMGQAAAARSSIRESNTLDMKQKEIMDHFHEGRCNLLVATSVLEEGVDVPSCNLIIRFDKIRTYCDYVQTKGSKEQIHFRICNNVSSSVCCANR